MIGHTPGPWVAVHNNWEVSTIYAGALPVAVCHIDGDVSEETEGILSGIKDANARLIAAAPDLLEALKDAVCTLEVSYTASDYAIDKARAAIAKATGEAA